MAFVAKIGVLRIAVVLEADGSGRRATAWRRADPLLGGVGLHVRRGALPTFLAPILGAVGQDSPVYLDGFSARAKRSEDRSYRHFRESDVWAVWRATKNNCCATGGWRAKGSALMISTINHAESPVLGGGASLPSRPSRTGDFYFAGCRYPQGPGGVATCPYIHPALILGFAVVDYRVSKVSRESLPCSADFHDGRLARPARVRQASTEGRALKL